MELSIKCSSRQRARLTGQRAWTHLFQTTALITHLGFLSFHFHIVPQPGRWMPAPGLRVQVLPRSTHGCLPVSQLQRSAGRQEREESRKGKSGVHPWEFLLRLRGLRTWLVSMRMRVWSPASLGGLRIWCCRELWCGPAAAAPIRPLAWEPPYAPGAALKRKQTNKKQTTTGVLLWLSKLRIQCCHCCGTCSIPGPGTSSCLWLGQKKKKRVNQHTFPKPHQCQKMLLKKAQLWNISLTFIYNCDNLLHVTKSKSHSQEDHSLFLKTLDPRPVSACHCCLVRALSSTTGYQKAMYFTNCLE